MRGNTRHPRVYLAAPGPLIRTVAFTVLQMRDTCCVKYKRAEDMRTGDGDRSRPQGKSYLKRSV